ncbi:MAG: hypothetical protein IPM98_03820 [Lewinellaceae bacterium]|nr:hypothetical protein [Lewinellaceae bacterium]
MYAGHLVLGDGSSTGPVGDATPISHTYTGTGIYEICYLIQELDPDSMVCWEYTHCDSVYVICDSCCLDYDLFCQTVMNATVVTVDTSLCKATLLIGNLPDCDVIEFINWGEGPNVFGPFMAGDMPMHTFSGSGSYIISYLAVERDPLTGLICFEKVLYDTITIVCDTCVCNMPNLTLTQNGVNYQLFCAQGPPTPVIPCPAAQVLISGYFGCVTPSGQPCFGTPVSWSLSGPNGLALSGSTTNNVQIIFSAAQINTPGSYLLTLSTLCPGAMTPCVCTVRWIQASPLPFIWTKPRVFLQGPYVPATQLMNDQLRVGGLIPLDEPYSDLTSFNHLGGGGGEQTTSAVLAVSGSNAIVDWVFLELRSAQNPATVVATRSALVQRDGDVVDVDGVSPVAFGIPADLSYYLTVRHRNHFGVQLGSVSQYPECLATEKDFTNLPPEGFYAHNGFNPAQRLIGGRYVLWAGNGRIDPQIKYNGSNNDRNTILAVVGLNTPNAIIPGYLQADYNLDGVVKYNGSANDRNILLSNVGLLTPSAVVEDQVAR